MPTDKESDTRPMGSGSPVAVARIRTSASALAFTPPPVRLRLKLIEASHFWSLFLQPQESSRIAPIVEWIEPWSPLRIEFGSRQVLRADFDPLPVEWLRRFRSVELQMLMLYPSGTAIANVKGTHAALATFARTLAVENEVGVREVRDAPRDTPLLTRAQDEALRAAVAAGYYQIPRPLNLRNLAAKLGVSSASLSERLRRAEARVIVRYTQDGGATPWDIRTILDARPPSGDAADEDSIWMSDPGMSAAGPARAPAST